MPVQFSLHFTGQLARQHYSSLVPCSTIAEYLLVFLAIPAPFASAFREALHSPLFTIGPNPVLSLVGPSLQQSLTAALLGYLRALRAFGRPTNAPLPAAT